VVHLHAVIRLDAVGDGGGDIATLCTTAALTAAIRLAVTKVSAPLPDGFSGSVRWGDQIDVKTVTNSSGRDGISPATTNARAVANYVAKYATKSTDAAGALDRRLRGIGDLDLRGVTGHLRRLAETAWNLGERSDLSRLRAWAHTHGKFYAIRLPKPSAQRSPPSANGTGWASGGAPVVMPGWPELNNKSRRSHARMLATRCASKKQWASTQHAVATISSYRIV